MPSEILSIDTGVAIVLHATVAPEHGLSNAIFVGAELLVNVIDVREFEWVFRSAANGEELSEAIVLAGETTRLLISLEGVAAARLKAGEQVRASLTATPGIQVLPATLLVDADNLTRMVSLSAESGAESGELQLNVTLTVPGPLPSATVMDAAALPVRVVREFTLSFVKHGGDPLSRAQVSAGSFTNVRLALGNLELLRLGEEIRVELLTTTVTTSVLGWRTDTDDRQPFSIWAAADQALLSGVVEARGRVQHVIQGITRMVPDTRVVPAFLPVDILPREFALLFETPEGRPFPMAQVLAGGATEVTLRLENPELLLAGEEVRVRLIGVGVNTDVEEVALTADMPSTGFTIEAAYDAALSPGDVEVRARGEIGMMDAVVAPVPLLRLRVEVVDRQFRLSVVEAGLPVSEVQVVAGTMRKVTVRVSGVGTALGLPSLVAGETLAVDFSYRGGAGVSLLPAGGTFSLESTELGVTLDATSIARDGTLTMTIGGAGLVNASVELMPVAVDVLSREFAGFTLSFATPGGEPLASAQVVAGGTAGVAVVLDNPELLSAGETVRVVLSTMTVMVVGARPELTLTADRPSTTFTIGADYDVAPLLGAVGVSGEVRVGSVLVGNTRVVSVSLPVEILPRESLLSFATPEGVALESLRIVARSAVTVRVMLDNPELLLAGEEVRVTLSAVPALTAVPGEVVLTAQMSSATFAIDTALGMGSPLLAVEASGEVHAGGDVAVNTRVALASLPVETLPREFTLSFARLGGEPRESLRILAGATTEVMVVLDNPGLLAAGEEVSMTLAESQVTVDRREFRLAAQRSSAMFTIDAAYDVVLLSGAVVAGGNVLVGDSIVADATVSSLGRLPVTIVERLSASWL